MNSVAEAFQAQVQADPSAPCLAPAVGGALSRADVWAQTETLAARLAGAGARPGERVSVVVEKSPEAFLLYLACIRAGYVYHPANIGYTDAELSYLIRDAEPAVLVCDPSRAETLGAIGDQSVLTLAADGTGTLQTAPTTELSGYQANDADWAALLYTSGTTGKPKGAMLSQGNLLSNAKTLVKAWQFTSADRLLHMLPIFHAHGLFVAGNTCLVAGAETLFESTFSTDRFFARLGEATSFMGVPTLYGRLLDDDRLSRETTGHMRLFVSGSAPLDAVAFEAFEARTGARILERYGMTETVMLTSNPYDGDRRPGSVGPPLPGVDLRIRKENGVLAEGREIGSVEVRGPNVFSGYFKLPEKTGEAFTDDGFFVTGDIGMRDENGYVTLVGRASDMIITGGYNVYPREVETALLDVPGIAEAVVFGVPHPDFGEGVTAVILASDSVADEAAIMAAVREQIATYKCPKRVLIRDALPKNAMGKVDRKALRAEFEALYAP